MKGLKKIHSCLLMILATTCVPTLASATTTFPTQTTNHGGVYVDLEGLYAQGTDTFLANYPFAEIHHRSQFFDIVDSFQNVERRGFKLDPKWGYRVAIGYDYPTCCPSTYGFSLEYTHLRVDDHQSIAVDPSTDTTINFIQPRDFFFRDFFFSLPQSNSADARLESNYHTLDLLAHKNFCVYRCINTQLFAGGRYLRLTESFHDHFATEPGSPITVTELDDITIDFSNKFNGVGPRVGFSTFVPLAIGFGITTEVAGDLILGSSQSEYAEAVSAIFLPGAPTDGTDHDAYNGGYKPHTKVVPGLSGKIGIAYHALFRNCSSLAIEIGYRGDKYYEVSDMAALMQAKQGTTDAPKVKDGLYHDFQISGPYFSLSFHV